MGIAILFGVARHQDTQWRFDVQMILLLIGALSNIILHHI